MAGSRSVKFLGELVADQFGKNLEDYLGLLEIAENQKEAEEVFALLQSELKKIDDIFFR